MSHRVRLGVQKQIGESMQEVESGGHEEEIGDSECLFFV